ncbi:MAG: L-aspartate oxidase [Oligoflexia bacterium]|nr:L-aspartate oxidase [Oligoflexia bacterium]
MAVKTDFLVVGSGLAGLFFALKAARFGEVVVLAKDSVSSTSTSMAQGGIASVTSRDDSFDNHIQDTLLAGAGLCKKDIVEMCVGQAPDRIQDLINFGVNFDKTSQGFELTREGGHSHRRILHSFDQTGLAIQNALISACKKNPKIKILENQMAVDLILSKDKSSCIGSYVLDLKTSSVQSFVARATVLATGGAGKVYLYTSNWDGATGDGIAMAKRAGCKIANMEFLQFHPTCLFHRDARNFLISEALRGEGAVLKDHKGYAFMKDYHALGNLAPRDIVARAIDSEMKKSGHDFVYLDITFKKPEETKKRFPGVYEKCLKFGIDITKDLIPVVPAAHYLCGGILTDAFGKTNLHGLFALGENACTGLHGANRLASNSLMEATVFAHNACEYLSKNFKDYTFINEDVLPWDSGNAVDLDEMIVVAHNWQEVRQLMWNYVGIVRSNKRLKRAKQRIAMLSDEIKEYYWNFKVNKDLLELRNIALIAELTIDSALMRKESRGIHYNIDYPKLDSNFAHDTII